MRILVTGSAGLIGRSLLPALRRAGHTAVPFDLVFGQDVRDAQAVRHALGGCDGVVHLAAVSRVAWAESNPDLCHSVNLGGTKNVVQAARGASQAPFLLFASSREVYGEPDGLPVHEDAPLRPLNVYARTKVQGEAMVTEASRGEHRSAIVRLSNVYGDVHDHADRVVPAFVRAAHTDGVLRVEGGDNLFDFTHVTDVAAALVRLVDALGAGVRPPPIHLVSGRGTTLQELAHLAVQVGGGGHPTPAAPRTYDVQRFVGDPNRAASEVGWCSTVALEDGLSRLAVDFSGLDSESP